MHRLRAWCRSSTARCGAYTRGAERQNGYPMSDNKNTIIAIALSALVLLGWQYFVSGPQQKVREEQLQAQKQQQAQQQTTQPGQNAQTAPAPAGPPLAPGQ